MRQAADATESPTAIGDGRWWGWNLEFGTGGRERERGGKATNREKEREREQWMKNSQITSIGLISPQQPRETRPHLLIV